MPQAGVCSRSGSRGRDGRRDGRGFCGEAHGTSLGLETTPAPRRRQAAIENGHTCGSFYRVRSGAARAARQRGESHGQQAGAVQPSRRRTTAPAMGAGHRHPVGAMNALKATPVPTPDGMRSARGGFGDRQLGRGTSTPRRARSRTAVKTRFGGGKHDRCQGGERRLRSRLRPHDRRHDDARASKRDLHHDDKDIHQGWGRGRIPEGDRRFVFPRAQRAREPERSCVSTRPACRWNEART